MSESIVRGWSVGADHPAFDGHFPGQPILPGVALLAEVMELARSEPALAAAIGAAPRIAVLKFLAPVRSGSALEVSFRLGARALDWKITEGARVVASGQFMRADAAAPASP